MMKFLVNPNSKVYQVLAKLIDLLLLNILFIVTSLPLITLGPSLLALNTVALKMVTGEEPSTASSYFKAFKGNLKRGIQLSFLLLFLFMLLLTSLFCLTSLKNGTLLVGVFSLTILTTIIGLLLLFIFPYNARYEDSFFHAIKVSLQIASLNVKQTLLIAGVLLSLVVLVTFNAGSFALGILLLLTVGFSTIALFINKQLAPIFKQYE